MMELRVLQYFLAVAREQSLSGAAEFLHLSQPTLSRQLRDLEDELGKQLFIRGNRGIVLTEEGMILRKRAEEIVELVQKTENEISLSDEAVAGGVCIGAGESDLNRYLARAARRMIARYPWVRFHISSGNAVFVMEQLDKGLIDFGLLYGAIDRTKYHPVRIPFSDRFGVLMRKDAPLARKAFITPEDLADKPLIVSRQDERDCWPVLAHIAQDPSKLNIVATYTLLFNGSLLVEEGLGYAVCFDKLINTTGDSPLCFRPLRPDLGSSPSIVWKKYQPLTKAAEKFLEYLHQSFHAAAEPAGLHGGHPPDKA